MKQLIRTLFTLVLTISFAGILFAQDTTVIETGQTTQERQLEPFNEIEFGGGVEAELIQGSVQQVTIVTEEGQYDKFITKVKKGVLKVTTKGSIDGKIQIICPTLTTIKVSEIAEVKSTSTLIISDLTIIMDGASELSLDLNVENLETKLNGICEASLSGTAKNHDLSINGTSILNAENLNTQNANVKLTGVSSANVNVTKKITGSVKGISYLTNVSVPEVDEVEYSTISEEIAGIENIEGLDSIKYIDVDLEDVDEIESMEDLYESIHKSKKEKSRIAKFDPNWSGVELGINTFVTKDYKFAMPAGSEFLELKIPNSMVVNLNLFEKGLPIIGQNFGIVTGIGFEFNNYKFENSNWIEMDDSLGLIGVPADPISFKKSKLSTTYLKVPLILEFQTHGKNKFHLSVGGNIGVRIGAHTKYKYKEDGKTVKDKDRDDFYLNDFRAEALVRVGIGKINLFANYSFLSLFENNKGPELYPFSFGFVLVNF